MSRQYRSQVLALYFREIRIRCKGRPLRWLCGKIKIASTDYGVVFRTIEHPKILDVADGLEWYSALGGGCKGIMTEDREDFYYSEMPVSSCEDFLMQHF